ncbi:two-component system, response regulator YesN [Gracilibacillus orientalis]|uniref:Two-component system, response regulator YesN n=1 Tax=Gracilibacillus orientalis TaxID=334253 RepID=A0A1I4J0W8_9BACI|nr:response regulator [Gracilibacillus orientalis]SFL59666.1 two-component system, response regulator YesN [Gracilibacillus orientalis]
MKAIIIDDEFIVLEGMKKMIDWSSYGIEIVGTADNGEDGIRLFNEHKPNIVFTDIRMPGKDGLTLVKEILQKSPDTLCVVFSGFNEFEYVRSALKLGVIDYLEKPITIPTIKETIEKILEHVKKQQELVALKENANQTEQIKIEKITMDLLLHNPNSFENWQTEMADESEKNIVGFMVIIHDATSLPLQQRSEHYFPIAISTGLNNIVVIYMYTSDTSIILKDLAGVTNENQIVGIGNMRTDAAELRNSYEEALKAYKHAIFRQLKGMIVFEEINRSSKISKFISIEEKEILYHIILGDQDLVYESLNNYFQKLEQETSDRSLQEEKLLKLFYLCFETVEEFQYTINNTNTFLSQTELQNVKSKDELKKWISSNINWIISSSQEYQRSKQHYLVERACKYIHRHYNQNISLQEIAEEVGLNPNYFSALFKEVMGMTYIKYLTHLRIEMAKLMLRHGDTVAEVSQNIGYATYRHFSDTFKKHTDVSPGKYKEGISK